MNIDNIFDEISFFGEAGIDNFNIELYKNLYTREIENNTENGRCMFMSHDIKCSQADYFTEPEIVSRPPVNKVTTEHGTVQAQFEFRLFRLLAFT